MPTDLEWTDAANTPIAALTFAAVAPGVASAWQNLRLWNDRDSSGADDARGVRLSALAKARGASVPYEATGIPILTYRAIEIDVTGAGIRSLGTSAEIVLPDIAAGEFLAIRARVRGPAGFALAAADVLLRLTDDPYEDLGNAAPTPGGIDLGQTFTQLFEGGAVSEDSPASEFVAVARGAAQVAGRMRAWADQTLELGPDDGDAATLASGESYGALVVVGPGGLEVVKGSKVTGSPAPGDFPLTPLDTVPLASAIQRFGENVETADLVGLRTIGGFKVSATAGFGLSIGKGIGIVGTRRVRGDVAIPFAAGASLTDAVLWLDERRQAISTDGTPLVPGEPLARYSTNGSAVTAIEDLRRVAGAWPVVSASLPGAAGGESAILAIPSSGIEICPIRGVITSLGDTPGALGNTSGEWEIDVEALIGGTWTSIYPDGAPTIAFDAASSWVTVTPQLMHFEAPALRVSLLAVPTGGTLAPLSVSVAYRAAYVG